MELERWCGAYEAGGARFLLVPRGCFLYATGDRVGLALPGGGRLVVVWGPENKTEIGAYAVSGGEVVGLWVPPGADQGDYSACGVERSVVEGESGRITSAFAIDKSAYAGRAVWVPRGPAIAGGKAGGDALGAGGRVVRVVRGGLWGCGVLNVLLRAGEVVLLSGGRVERGSGDGFGGEGFGGANQGAGLKV